MMNTFQPVLVESQFPSKAMTFGGWNTNILKASVSPMNNCKGMRMLSTPRPSERVRRGDTKNLRVRRDHAAGPATSRDAARRTPNNAGGKMYRKEGMEK